MLANSLKVYADGCQAIRAHQSSILEKSRQKGCEIHEAARPEKEHACEKVRRHEMENVLNRVSKRLSLSEKRMKTFSVL